MERDDVRMKLGAIFGGKRRGVRCIQRIRYMTVKEDGGAGTKMLDTVEWDGRSGLSTHTRR